MPHRLRDGLSFCEVEGGRVIFLDIPNDRYFRLPPVLERTFISCMRGEASDTDISSLIERNILTRAPMRTGDPPRSTIERPVHSVVERKPASSSVPFPVLLEVFALTCWIQFQLKTRTLQKLLDGVAGFRSRRIDVLQASPAEPIEPCLLDAAVQFRLARLYVPIEPCCLLDSLAMVTFLAKRHFHSCIVFGVTTDPFAAHSWVQAGNTVFNDSVGNASAYTPIRVV